MKILLLTHNHVVREFVSLAADKSGAELDFVESISSVDWDSYDMFFVDDRRDYLSQSYSMIGDLTNCTSVLLYNEENATHSNFDITIKKPFLPSDIQAVISNMDAYMDTSLDVNNKTPYHEQILNLSDIDEIKGLLDDDEEPQDLMVPSETLAERIKRSIDLNTDLKNNNSASTEEKLLESITTMEPKKIRKLLAGASVTISIKFPKEK